MHNNHIFHIDLSINLPDSLQSVFSLSRSALIFAIISVPFCERVSQLNRREIADPLFFGSFFELDDYIN